MFVSECPAVEEALDALANATTVSVREVSLPLYWVAREASREATELLASSGAKNVLLVSDETWAEFPIDFVPQFFLLDSDGVLVARGWPNPEFLRVLPDVFQEGFEERCVPVKRF